MATLMTIAGTIEQGALLRDALCSNYFYEETLNGEPNPESKTEFARRMIRRILKEEVRKYRVNEVKAAIGAASEQADTETEGLDIL